ncbi:P-loop NTPase fold protein [Desulfogranum marinum]|uniref:P-loop NTPase fold protein n=1 Tax=Desulfogranum marinum TaxID=453220 RepID=UPI001965602D|nr:P-loop NTPase fold protein [Desulfogranum marinum]MBM9515264.1 hypothetical protein [Desulfogranum marinum]
MDAKSNIVKAVKTYIETPDTKYAIMIDGDWGCGKTFLWKNILLPEVGESEAIYVSMFGLKDINDIENEIFKSLSMMGADDDGVLKGLLNSNPNMAEDIRFGGLGFAVQFGLKKWKETRIKKSKRLFICFDDLERWAGDIEICLSYINKLAEHNGAKCLVIGNAKDIEKKNKNKFQDTKEKTIGFKYKLAYSPETVLKAAISLVNFPSPECQIYIENILTKNSSRIFDLLTSANCSNIRTVSTAIHYLTIIYSNNKEKFAPSPASAISYFISLLSTLILVEHHKNSNEDRKKILDPSVNNSYQLTEKLGIKRHEDNGQLKKLTDEDRIIKHLINTAFYQTNEIKLQGKFSIINYGFYRAEDFEDEFTEWKETEDYEYYMDTFKFWYLDDEESNRIFSNTCSAMFEKKNITHPSILLLLTNRLINDIKRGVVDLDFEKTKSDIRQLFEELYEQKRMEPLRSIDLRGGTRRFEYCEEIYTYVVEKNKEYYESSEKIDLSKFWVKLKENPDSLNELMDKYKSFEIFALYDTPEEIAEVIESLRNDQLFKLTRWMGSRINEEQSCLEAVDKEHDRAQAIAEILEKKYNNQYGVKAGHIKQIARVIRNKRTDYDPEYIDKNKKT